ncbi:pericentriolar material 1 protein-like isoform X2 [Stylophora pistillata]|uniref:pericentriolar material 1 protein-like isoform X2 n=1 Tax=Stylophora pistillata TaxID=50429 RepID=UPI000C03F672|nr:pericentriolar material 1 protein-like isoform X2 [Stylophora pistillata]
MAERLASEDASRSSQPLHGPRSEPRSQRQAPRQYPASLDTDLSLITELRRSEEEASGHRSLPNNLGWSSRASALSPSAASGATKKKGKHFEQVKLPSKARPASPSSDGAHFTRKRHHTPATVPRTRLPPGTPLAERLAMESLKQKLSFEEKPERDEEGSRSRGGRSSQNQSSSTANNERALPTQPRVPAAASLPVLEMNETETARTSTEAAPRSRAPKVNTPLIIARLNQVRGFLKQATEMFVTLQSTDSDKRSSELNAQAVKIARLIKQLKQQETAYVELLERSVAVEHDSTLENTPSLSLQSLTEEEKSESASLRDEELQGLRQQHALLKKMLEQQQQLKELQTRQATLLTLQRDAEMRLAEAEEEGQADPDEPGATGGEVAEPSRSRGASGTSQTSAQLDLVPERPSASVLDDRRFTPQELELINLLRKHKEKWRAADSGDEKETDERENHGTKRTNQPTAEQAPHPETSSEVADSEAALALANATQERLELENKLMVLEAKKEQMDTLLKELQSLKEAQLRKESLDAAGGASASVNESKQEEDEPLATTSQKLDDERILEALEVHEKLKSLQEVRDRLSQLRELIGQYQPTLSEVDRPENGAQVQPERERLSLPVQSTEEEEEMEGAVGGGTGGTDEDLSSIEWMLSAGVEDPDLMAKIRQLQEARARVTHLFKQTNENVQPSPARVNNEPVPTQAAEEESEAETQTDTDAESAVSGGSSSVNALAWQDDPEFQAKVRKLNSAKQKLKQLQELVKKIQQFPESSPTLPAELAELSFDEDDFDEDDDGDDDDDDDEAEEGEEDDDEDGDESNRSETSYDNERGNVQNEDEEVSTATEDEEAGEDAAASAALNRNRMLDLEESDQEAVYQRYLQKQTAELEQLQQERQRLLKVQEELARISRHTEKHKTVSTQTFQASQGKPQKPVTAGIMLRPGAFSTSGGALSKRPVMIHAPVNREISTQTPFYGSDLRVARSVDSSEPPRARPSALVWSELRRQRELHEEKLKKRKQKFLEKRKKSGLDDLSEGGTYSVRSGRSGDIDEGFGVSMMSADITTATWGGSTQPSSTQNDSAVSADESDEGNEVAQIAVEVEDDYPDGIVQAEEEEEERLEPEAFSGSAQAVFRSRERVPRMTAFRGSVDSTSQPSSGKKRKIDGTTISGGARKRERERGLTFEDWPRTFYFDRNSRGRIRQENFTPAEQLIKEREQEQFNMERQAWEQHCERLHQEVSDLSTLCNGLLRDQQLLVSTVIGRSVPTGPAASPNLSNIPGPSLGGNPFEQYQQRQQEAYQGLQSFFDHQRYMQQQHQILQSLNQCYSQLQQQHHDMAALQHQFQQLFTYNPSTAATEHNPSPHRPQTVTPSVLNNASPSFMSLPSHSVLQPPFSAPLVSQSPFTSTYRPPSSAPVFRTSWYPQFGQQTASTDPSRQSVQETFSVNPDTGIPSPRSFTQRGHPVEPAPSPPPTSSGTANPVMVVREVGPSATGGGLSPANARLERKYDPNSYKELTSTSVNASRAESSPDVIGRTFNTPMRAAAAASLAQKDKSASRSAEFSLAQKLAAESVETSSRASSVPGDAQDVAKGSWQEADRASEAGSEFSLFEALRDSIYSEVATLISLNESRPHFLLELFRELQLLTSDYLRQRALYALQDLVTRFLTEDSVGAEGGPLEQARFQEWLGSNSELTPSETVETFEDDESETREATVPAETVTEGIYDYAENVESGSTLSTPTSSHTGEAPFASEGLGDTVIHLDKALSRMREYERLRTEGKLTELVSGSALLKGDKHVKDDVTTSSAGDVGSESSISDVQYPRIDTQALDHLIKSIMSEVIPCLNEHMEDTCTSELLGYIRSLVLSRIQVNEDQEFGRFFHKQLASILQDSLSRFTDRTMKDCGEDMLVDMSEILFNELAFFRLMQDLDGGRGASQRPTWRQGFDSASTDTGTGQDGDKEDDDDTEEKENNPPEDSAVEEEGVSAADEREEAEGEEEEQEDDVSSEESSSEESGAEDDGADDEGPEDEEEEDEAAAAMPISKEQQEAEEEDLGKVR